MVRNIEINRERWPLSTPFRISRGVKVAADVVTIRIEEGGVFGQAEAVPYARYDETLDSVEAQLRAITPDLEAGSAGLDAQDYLPPGAARNALDCALWDLAARRAGSDVATLLGREPLPAMETAVTLSLDSPLAMAAAARALGPTPLLKLKVNADEVEATVDAVRQVAPEARLIVDPNESWTIWQLARFLPALQALKVDLVEQPLPAADDEALRGLDPPVPICADESCHVAGDLDRLAGLYQAVNIKLDKTGGLTEALALYAAARAKGFQVMVGCMVCTSLAIAPALHIARDADFVDLDGPMWLRTDRPGGAHIRSGRVSPPEPGFWGSRGDTDMLPRTGRSG